MVQSCAGSHEYKSVGSELVLKERSYGKKCYQNKRRQAGSAKTEDRPVQEAETQAEPRPLDMYSVQELWDELRKRGCYIEDGKLAMRTIHFFD